MTDAHDDPDAFLRQKIATQRASIAPYEFAGRGVWLKKAGPRNPRWRYLLLGALAAGLRMEVLRPVMNLGGEAAIAHEARRLAELAALGLRVPRVLAARPDGLLLSDLGAPGQPAYTLLVPLAAAAREGPRAALAQWRRGLDAVARVHAAGSYLSQAFARNLVDCPDGVIGYIDFEDDPGASLTLAQCQARDWLSYLHSTAALLPQEGAAAAHARDDWRRVLAAGSGSTREALAQVARGMAWMRRLPAGPRWGTDTARLRAAALFISRV